MTKSRSKITKEMYKALSGLNPIIVSGASKEQMISQLGKLPCTLLAQNGNDNHLWKRELTLTERARINLHIRRFSVLDERLEDRGCQISYSFTGHHAPKSKKKRFDPTGAKRKAILDKYPAPFHIQIKIGGTTCLDYIPLHGDKGANISKYIKKMEWMPSECLYIGDALFHGGNDESVQGVIPTFQVGSPEDTLAFLKQI